MYPNTKGPHKEEKVNPVNYYGLTKLEAEKNEANFKKEVEALTFSLRSDFR